MDNDLMARRLRPPSEPPQPQDGNSPSDTDQQPWTTDFEPAPWATDLDARADVPWDRPDNDHWPPTDQPWTADDPAAEQSWMPSPDVPTSDAPAIAEPEVLAIPGFDASPVPEPEVMVGAAPEASTWDATPAPWDHPDDSANNMAEPSWDAPAAWAETADSATDLAAPDLAAPDLAAPAWDTPAAWDAPAAWDEPAAAWPEAAASWDETSLEPADEQLVATVAEAPSVEPEHEPEPEPAAEDLTPETLDLSVSGTAPWDQPEPYALGDTATEPAQADDPRADLFAGYADFTEPRTTAAEEPQVSASAGEADPPPWVVNATDPDDALAPVLGDVEQQSLPPWSGWTDEAAVAAAVPPAVATSALGPTPPDDLFDAPSAPEQEAESEQVAESEQAVDSELSPAQIDAAVPAVIAATPSGQPVVVRIEVAIVDGNVVVRPLDATGQAVPAVLPEVVAADGEPDGSLTPRHPEFEPRAHLNGTEPAVADSVPEEAVAPATWLDQPATEPPVFETDRVSSFAEPESGLAPRTDYTWALPAVEAEVSDPWAPTSAPASDQPWQNPDPLSTWTLETAEPDVLTALPAASPALESPYESQHDFAPADESDSGARPDLWFLSSEPEMTVTQDGQAVAREPSSAMTAGLTVLMAVVVIGLVIAFLWLMTSVLR